MITTSRIVRASSSLTALAVAALLGLGVTACGNGLQTEPPPDRGSVVAAPGGGADDENGSGQDDSTADGSAGDDDTGTDDRAKDPDSPVSSDDQPGADRDGKQDDPNDPGDGDHGKGDAGKDDGRKDDGDKGDGDTDDAGKRGNDGNERGQDDQDGQGNGTGGSANGGRQKGDRGNPRSSARCTLNDLRIGVNVPDGGGAAGSQYVMINFTNTSDTACMLKGYAGVSFVGHQDGTQLGEPARRTDRGHVGRVDLAPGAQVTELLQIANAGNFDADDCAPTTADGFRIYPPESYTAAYVPFEHQACQHGGIEQLTIYPIGAR